MEWMLLPLKRYAEFSGRSRRMEYWMFTLGLTLLSLFLAVVLFAVGGAAIMNAGSDPANMVGLGMGFFAIILLFVLVGLALIIPSLAVTVRRLHDTDRSGWWLGGLYGSAFLAGGVAQISEPLGLVLNIGYVILAIAVLVFMFLPGTKGPNRFGEDPKGTSNAEVFA